MAMEPAGKLILKCGNLVSSWKYMTNMYYGKYEKSNLFEKNIFTSHMLWNI